MICHIFTRTSPALPFSPAPHPYPHFTRTRTRTRTDFVYTSCDSVATPTLQHYDTTTLQHYDTTLQHWPFSEKLPKSKNLALFSGNCLFGDLGHTTKSVGRQILTRNYQIGNILLKIGRNRQFSGF